jgi:hypothetical protein
MTIYFLNVVENYCIKIKEKPEDTFQAITNVLEVAGTGARLVLASPIGGSIDRLAARQALSRLLRVCNRRHRVSFLADYAVSECVIRSETA